MEVFIVYSLENKNENVEDIEYYGNDYILYFQGVMTDETQADLLILALKEDGINCVKEPMNIDGEYAMRHIKKYLTEQQNKLKADEESL